MELFKERLRHCGKNLMKFVKELLFVGGVLIVVNVFMLMAIKFPILQTIFLTLMGIVATSIVLLSMYVFVDWLIIEPVKSRKRK